MTRDLSQQIQVASCFGSDGPPALVVGSTQAGFLSTKCPFKLGLKLLASPSMRNMMVTIVSRPFEAHLYGPLKFQTLDVVP